MYINVTGAYLLIYRRIINNGCFIHCVYQFGDADLLIFYKAFEKTIHNISL